MQEIVILPSRLTTQLGLILTSKNIHLFSSFGIKGSLNWYCIDYWSAQTKIDIQKLKEDNAASIAMRADVPRFLEALKKRNIQRVLLTNAHPGSLALKRRTPV